jgi:cob(I)alamin adenosyltransferase
MVRLTRIYTRTGDDGTTGLGDGTRVPKTSLRIEAYGTVDELNAVLGLCVEEVADEALRARIHQLQNDLFDVGADLCVPMAAQRTATWTPLRIGGERITRLEHWIDEVNADLKPLKSFVLPGGNRLAAPLHLARTVCRRAERRVIALGAAEAINQHCVVYLNRLSDLLFVIARAAAGAEERLWVPTRDEPGPPAPPHTAP